MGKCIRFTPLDGNDMVTETLPLAVHMMPMETRREAILSLATRADELGYKAVFLPETWSYDITALLAEAAVRTQQIHLGTGVLGIWGRSSATIAMASSTLNTLSNGRFILGLGSSTRQLVEGLHDVSYAEPYEKLRQAITQTRALLNGDRIPLSNTTESSPLRLNLPAHPDLPIYLAASSNRSIRIAGELCDGWLPFLMPRDHLSEGIALIAEAGESQKELQKHVQICPVVPVSVANDTGSAREGAAWVLAFYLKTMGPIYRRTLARIGHAKEVEAILGANRGRNVGAVPPEAEGLLEQLTIYGTPQEAREKVSRWYSAGAEMPILMLNPDLDQGDAELVLSTFST